MALLTESLSVRRGLMEALVCMTGLSHRGADGRECWVMLTRNQPYGCKRLDGMLGSYSAFVIVAGRLRSVPGVVFSDLGEKKCKGRGFSLGGYFEFNSKRKAFTLSRGRGWEVGGGGSNWCNEFIYSIFAFVVVCAVM